MTSVPAPARWLGLAGLLPVLAGTALTWLDPSRQIQLMATAVTLLYGGLILSFLGGAWWGLATSPRGTGAGWGELILSVVPSLFAWPVVAWAWIDASYGGAAWLLAFGFALALVVDGLLVRQTRAPVWWMALRRPLSLGMAGLFFALGARFFF